LAETDGSSGNGNLRCPGWLLGGYGTAPDHRIVQRQLAARCRSSSGGDQFRFNSDANRITATRHDPRALESCSVPPWAPWQLRRKHQPACGEPWTFGNWLAFREPGSFGQQRADDQPVSDQFAVRQPDRFQELFAFAEPEPEPGGKWPARQKAALP
jgi:hypothetical protein